MHAQNAANKIGKRESGKGYYHALQPSGSRSSIGAAKPDMH